jgi:hypothetical protein
MTIPLLLDYSNEPPRGKRTLAARWYLVGVEIIYVVRSGKEII